VKVSLSNFRCFSNVANVRIRPLTILVGENSAGKTSFLAAVRFIFDLIQGGSASFNRSPFFMGAFEQLVYVKGDRGRRVKSFSFEAEFSTKVRESPFRLSSKRRTIGARLGITFSNKFSQPVFERLLFAFDDQTLEFAFEKEPFILISRVGKEDIRLSDPALVELKRDDYSLDTITRMFSLLRFGKDSTATLINNNKELGDAVEFLLSSLLDLGANLPQNTVAFAPVRTKPERTYNPIEATSTPGGDHIPMLLAQIQKFEPEKWGPLQDQLDIFGKSAGLFSHLEVKRLSSSESGPFQIIVEVGGRRVNIIDVGYGVSQVLPILVELIRAERDSLFLLQQPEVHLHPVAQAELASFIGGVVSQRKHTVIVETHSDHFLDRVRMDVRDKKALRPQDVAVLFFERVGLDVHIHEIELDKMGNVLNAPATYRKFFLEEMMRSLDGGMHNN
jgi:predicted ATPase